MIARWIHVLKSKVQLGLIQLISVKGKQNRSNPLTKTAKSPTIFWKEAEYLQGSQEGIKRMQKLAAEYGAARTNPAKRGINHSLT
jgi:hypothetical protein